MPNLMWFMIRTYFADKGDNQISSIKVLRKAALPELRSLDICSVFLFK
jgi:hypothetical protein